jgi:branched-chain amino acid transport system ATP-binding protein
MKALLREPLLPLVLGAIVYCLAANNYHLYLIVIGATTVIVGVGLNVLIGLTGQVSFGHVGFYAIGAYAVAILTGTLGWSFWIALPIAALLAAVVGALLGLAALRVSGPYLAMVTIAFGFIVEFGAVEWRDLTGGANGLMNIPRPFFAGAEIGDRALALLALAFTVAALLAYRRLAASGWGLAMRAVRDSETAASSLGFNPLVTRTAAFTISAFAAGVAGGFFAPLTQFVSPSSFSFFQSILFVLVVMIGGAERTYGPVIGAIVVIAAPELLSGLAEYRVLFFGVLLLVVLWIAPGGIAGLIARRFRAQRAAPAGPAAATAVSIAPAVGDARLAVDGLGIAFGGLQAVTELSFAAEPGKVTSLIGPNGAGKTTVLNMVCGFYRPSQGHIAVGTTDLTGAPAHRVARAGIARTFQTSLLFGQLTVRDNVLAGLRHGRLGSAWRPAAAGDDLQRAAQLLAFVGFQGDVDQAAAGLSHIDKRLVEIARALALSPSMLMLDEPAAGLGKQDTDRLAALLRRIADAGLGVVLIEHDMTLVMGISDHIVVLDAGRSIAQGTPDVVRRDPAVIKAYLGEGGFDSRPRPAHWQPKDERMLEVAGLQAGYSGVGVLRGVDLRVSGGELVAVLGANGAGKSTLMRALSGLLRPVSGSILFVGREVMRLEAHELAKGGLVLVPEGRQVFPELTVVDNLRLGAYTRGDAAPDEIEAMLARFPKLAARRGHRAGLLSGGEQQMLAIARGLIARPKVLLLDEPSLGLAPGLINELFRVAADLRDEGVTILLVDQMAALALAVADRGYVIESGAIVHQGTPAELRRDEALEKAYLGAV